MRTQAKRVSTTVEWPSAIDHHLVSDDLWRRYLPRTAWVERPSYIAGGELAGPRTDAFAREVYARRA